MKDVKTTQRNGWCRELLALWLRDLFFPNPAIHRFWQDEEQTKPALITRENVLQLETLSEAGGQNFKRSEAVKICRHYGNCRD